MYRFALVPVAGLILKDGKARVGLRDSCCLITPKGRPMATPNKNNIPKNNSLAD